jgi:hypothetical protein
MLSDKKGGLGQGIDWTVALIIILFVLVILLFSSVILGGVKGLKIYDYLSDKGANEINVNGEDIRTPDLLISKDLYMILNSERDYSSGKSSILDILKRDMFSNTKQIDSFIISNLKNEFDVIYKDCYKICVENLISGDVYPISNGCMFFDDCGSLEVGGKGDYGRYEYRDDDLHFLVSIYMEDKK